MNTRRLLIILWLVSTIGFAIAAIVYSKPALWGVADLCAIAPALVAPFISKRKKRK